MQHEERPCYLSMAGFRDVLIHNYDDLNMETIWETVDAYLPSAVKQIEKILNKI